MVVVLPRVVFQDEWLLVVDKPAGMATHAAQGVVGVDLLAWVRARAPEAALLHRLDREASGLVLFGRRPAANALLQQQLEAHTVERTYLAVCAGRLAAARTIDRPVPDRAQGRTALHRRPPPDARPARSHVTPISAVGTRATLVEVRLETGRKHQIRVHLASIGHALVGDRRYGGPPAPRLLLHAARLAFHHPADGRAVSLEAPLPPDFTAACAALGQ